MRVALAAFLLVVFAVVAEAQSPAGQVRVWATRYHEDPPSIDRMRAELTQAVTADPSVDNLVALAEVCFIWGDIRAKTTDDKLAAYDQGRQAAQRAVELAPRSVTAHLWYAIDTGRWGQTKGIMRSLFLLPIVRRRSTRCWRSTPSSRRPIPSPATSTSRCPACWAATSTGRRSCSAPGSGSIRRSRACGWASPRRSSRRAASPKPGRSSSAVLAEKAPHNLADWTLKDSVEARQLLDSIRGRPGG